MVVGELKAGAAESRFVGIVQIDEANIIRPALAKAESLVNMQ